MEREIQGSEGWDGVDDEGWKGKYQKVRDGKGWMGKWLTSGERKYWRWRIRLEAKARERERKSRSLQIHLVLNEVEGGEDDFGANCEG